MIETPSFDTVSSIQVAAFLALVALAIWCFHRT
jgi:hypothetical protein